MISFCVDSTVFGVSYSLIIQILQHQKLTDYLLVHSARSLVKSIVHCKFSMCESLHIVGVEYHREHDFGINGATF